MKKLILGLVMICSASVFGKVIDTACLSSVAKEHNAAYTQMSFDLNSPGTATRTEFNVNGKVTPSVKLDILDIETVKGKDGKLQYIILDVDAEFYVCSLSQ